MTMIRTKFTAKDRAAIRARNAKMEADWQADMARWAAETPAQQAARLAAVRVRMNEDYPAD